MLNNICIYIHSTKETNILQNIQLIKIDKQNIYSTKKKNKEREGKF